MKTKRHTIRLAGERARGARIAASVLHELTGVLLESTRGALRLRVEGRSFARGTTPAWLANAADFDVIGISEGSTVLEIEAPSLAEASVVFQQQSLFHSINPADSAFELMEESFSEAAAGRDTEIYDQALLAKFTELDVVFASGYDAIDICSGDSRRRLQVRKETIESVERLRRRTPEPQRVRVSGKLDTIRHSDRMFTLQMASGQAVKGVAEGIAAEKMASLFGQEVIVSGLAVFRPSGAVLRIEAENLEEAGSAAAVWAHVPSPLFRPIDAPSLRQPQGPRSGLNAIIGRWPGDESDEEITSALRELS